MRIVRSCGLVALVLVLPAVGSANEGAIDLKGDTAYRVSVPKGKDPVKAMMKGLFGAGTKVMASTSPNQLVQQAARPDGERDALPGLHDFLNYRTPEVTLFVGRKGREPLLLNFSDILRQPNGAVKLAAKVSPISGIRRDMSVYRTHGDRYFTANISAQGRTIRIVPMRGQQRGRAVPIRNGRLVKR